MKPFFRLNSLPRLARSRVRFKPLSVTYLAVFAFFAIGFVYVFAVNFVANKGAVMRNIETDNRNLQAENERLEVEAARLKALRVIEDGASKEVKVGDLEETPANLTSAVPENKQVVMVPRMVQTQSQRYLPSYSTLAQR
ncbi:MAG: hypothetical protein V1826_02070 [bacterium]